MKKQDIYIEIGKKTIEWAKLQKEANKLKEERGSVGDCNIQSNYPAHEAPCVIEYRDNLAIDFEECCESCKNFLKVNPKYLKKAYAARGVKISIRNLIKKFETVTEHKQKLL